MIDISTINMYNDNDIKDLKDLDKIEGVVLYCEHSLFKYEYDDIKDHAHTNYATNTHAVDNGDLKKSFHIIIDERDIAIRVPFNKQTEHLKAGKQTYIDKALYQGKTNEKTISVLIMIPKDQKYENIERKAIKYIADILIKNELTVDNLMRGLDLNRSGSPLHLLDKNKWEKFIKLLTRTFDEMKENGEKYDDKNLEKASTTYRDKEVREFYLDHKDDAKDYADKIEPDHRNIKAILDYKSNEPGEIKLFSTKNNTNFSYTVTENAPSDTSHCSKAFDTLVAKANPNTLEVEPIYPDLAVPPGGTITISNNLNTNKNTVSSSTTLSSDEFEKRQQSFNVNDFKDAVKKVSGKPVNNNDPYPVDDKIKELESHMPKVKIDEVNFKLHDCNHPGSIIGPAVSKNFAMVQDEMITIAKRTERRLVRLENILATITRNLFRTSARMHINCMYYGGQDIYGKIVLNLF